MNPSRDLNHTVAWLPSAIFLASGFDMAACLLSDFPARQDRTNKPRGGAGDGIHIGC